MLCVCSYQSFRVGTCLLIFLLSVIAVSFVLTAIFQYSCLLGLASFFHLVWLSFLLSVCLSVFPVCPYVICLSFSPSLLSFLLSVCLSVFPVDPSVCLSVCLSCCSFCLFVCPSFLSVLMSVVFPSFLSFLLSVCLSVFPVCLVFSVFHSPLLWGGFLDYPLPPPPRREFSIFMQSREEEGSQEYFNIFFSATVGVCVTQGPQFIFKKSFYPPVLWIRISFHTDPDPGS